MTYTYSPVDEAEKVAMEIYQDSGDNSAIKMILQVYHATEAQRITRAVGTVPDASTAFAGVHISAVLINKSLSQGQGALRLSETRGPAPVVRHKGEGDFSIFPLIGVHS